MSDIRELIKRLWGHEKHAVHDYDDDCCDAADTMEKLLARNELLEAVLVAALGAYRELDGLGHESIYTLEKSLNAVQTRLHESGCALCDDPLDLSELPSADSRQENSPSRYDFERPCGKCGRYENHVCDDLYHIAAEQNPSK